MGRLAAVVTIDMVDSTSLLEEHGTQAAIAGRRAVDSAITRACQPSQSQVIDTNGDGTTLLFDSYADARRAATRLQSVPIALTEAAPPRPVFLRVGVAVGEVSPIDQAAGGAVRESAHLCSVCEPGSIMYSDAAEQLRGSSQLRANSSPSEGSHQRTGSALRAVVFADLTTAQGTHVVRSELLGDRLRREVFQTAVATNRGTLIDTNGNGVVALFSSATEALRACSGMRRRLEALNRGMPGERAGAMSTTEISAQSMSLQIGISVGDVSFDGNDLFGATVVEAARLQSKCPPDQVLATDAACRFAGSLDAFLVEESSEFHLKGLRGSTIANALASEAISRSRLTLPRQVDKIVDYQFVGMDSILNNAHSCWERAQRGDTQFVLLAASQGGGKSRVASEVAKTAHAAGATILYGACQAELAIPYHPFVSALRQAVNLDPSISDAFEHGSGSLSALQPHGDPGRARPVNTPQSGTPHLRSALFDSISQTLDRLAAGAPIVIVLDDLHWATAATIQMLEHVVDSLTHSNLMILGTTRHDENDLSGGALRSLLDRRRSENPDQTFDLPNLDWRSIATLLVPHQRRLIDLSSQVGQVARYVELATGGNPLYVEETLAHLRRSGVLHQDGERWLPVDARLEALTLPSSIMVMASERVERVSSTMADLLAIASLSGEVFDVETTAAVAGLDLDQAIDELEVAEGAGLIRESAQVGRYLFPNALIPTAMRQTLRPTRQARLHQQLAEFIEDRWPSRIDELVHHWSQAIGPAGKARTAHFLQRAGDRDAEAFAWGAAINRFSEALEILTSTPDLDPSDSQLAHVWLSLGYAQRSSGIPAFQASMKAAATFARPAGHADLVARAAIGMMRPGAWHAGAGVVYPDIVELCEDALVLLSERDPLRVHVETALATTLVSDPDTERCKKHLQAGQELAESLGDPYLIGVGLVADVFVSNAPDERDHRLDVCARLAAIGRAMANPDFRFVAGFFQAVAGLEVGDTDTVASRLASLQPDLDETKNYWYESLVATLRTAVDIVQCRPDMAAVVDANMERFSGTPHDTQGVWTVQHGLIAFQSGTLGELIAPLESALDAASELPWETGLALGRMQRGDLELAAEVFDYERDFDEYWLAAMHAKAEVAYQVGDLVICQDLFDRLIPYRDQVAFVSRGSTIAGPIAIALGQLAIRLDDLDRAESLLCDGLEQAQRMQAWAFVAEAKNGLARVHLERDGDAQAAGLAVEEALDLAVRHGFGFHEKQSLKLLHTIKVGSHQ